jgi:hypothetical protein
LREARAWRARAQVELGRGWLDAPCRITLREAADRWLAEARTGVVRTRSGDRYKPSALRSYEQALNARLLPRFGDKRMSAISRGMLQELVDELVGAGCAPSTVRNAILPLRAIYRSALRAGARGGKTAPKSRPAEAELSWRFGLLAAVLGPVARPSQQLSAYGSSSCRIRPWGSPVRHWTQAGPSAACARRMASLLVGSIDSVSPARTASCLSAYSA